MDGIRGFLQAVQDHGLADGRLRGLFHLCIGRRILTADSNPVSTGVTWRELAALLKLLRFDKELVRELGADPDALSPRDRQRFWYTAIGLAAVDGPAARIQAEELARLLIPLGYVVADPGTAAK